MLSYCGSFCKGHIQPNAKISKFVAKTHFILRSSPAMSKRKHPVLWPSYPQPWELQGVWKQKSYIYYSHIYTKHSEYAFLQPPNTFSGNNLKISLCLQTFHTLCFPFFPHTLFFTHSILYFLHTLFCILYLFQINVPGTIALKLEVLQLKRYQDNEEIHPKHIIFLNN